MVKETENMCKLSIVIPVYNGAPYINSCLENLDKQTFKDWEAIFVNDGSPDNTWKVLTELVTPKEKCKAVSQTNGGTSKARNTGLANATGQYVTFMDVDDELDPCMYETLVGMMDETGADIATCGYWFKVETDKGEPYLEPKSYPTCFLADRAAIRSKLVDLWDKDMLYNVWNKMYRMDLIKNYHLQYRVGHVYTEDRVFNRACLEVCSSIAITEQCLYYYIRERTGSTSEKYREDYFDIRHKEYMEAQLHFKVMDAWDAKAQEYVCREFVERVAGCIENIFHAENTLTDKEKKMRIAEVISHLDVREALKYAKCRSKKMKILVMPLKLQNTELTWLIYKMIYIVRKSNPALFHKLKGKR